MPNKIFIIYHDKAGYSEVLGNLKNTSHLPGPGFIEMILKIYLIKLHLYYLVKNKYTITKSSFLNVLGQCWVILNTSCQSN